MFTTLSNNKIERTISPSVYMYVLRLITKRSVLAVRVTGYESLPTEEGRGEAGRQPPDSCSRRIRKSLVKILPLLHSEAELALISGVTIRKDLNLLYCMQPSFTPVNLTPLHKYLLFCPIQIIAALIMGTVYFKKQLLSLPFLIPSKKTA